MKTVNAKGHIARLTASCLILTALFGGAASADSVTVTADRLNMRKEADASSKAVSVISRGEGLSLVSQNGEWLQVKDGEKTGYVMRQYVNLDLTQLQGDIEENTEIFNETKTGKATERVNMRALPMTDADIVKVVQKNNKVEITGQCGAWYQVEFSGKTGYVMAEYLTVEEEAAPTVPQPEEDTGTQDTVWAEAKSGRATVRVNMRASATTSSGIVKVVGKNDSVTVLGENNGWYKVSYGGEEGYISKAYISLTETPAAPTEPTEPETGDTLYNEAVKGAATERVNMRQKPTTSSSILKVIAEDQSVSILGENGGWYKVSASGREGYISKSYIRVTSGTDDGDGTGDAVVPGGFVSYPAARSGRTTERVNMRAAASTGASIQKVLSKGASVSVLGEQNNFYQVTYGGAIGFVSKSYVTLGTDADDSADNTEGDSSEVTYNETKAAHTTVQVNMRREPEGEVLFLLPKGTAVTLTGENGGWYKVIYSNSTGYISKAYVEETVIAPDQPEDDKPTEVEPDTSGEGTTAYITADSLNMRKGPGTGYGIVKVLKKGAEIKFYSLSDGWYLIKAGEDTGYVSQKYVSTTKPEVAPSNPGGEQEKEEVEIGKVQQADWWTSNIQKVFKVGVIATVTDVDTGLSWQVKRSGGTNHADVQPLTAADTAIMFKAYNNKWSWDRHAIWVTIDGVSYAASMNGMPHGTGSITTNNFDGHHCIHFLNSRTHTGNRWDTQHQAMVQKAYKAGQ